MPEIDNTRENTLIKLGLYRSYLESYLLVLQHVKNIIIFDIFAGSGLDQNKEEGSALIAAREIDKAIAIKPSRKILLKLNDSDSKNYESLLENLKRYNFVSIKNLDANQYIKKLHLSPYIYRLFFIDPFGYTQISSDSYKKLFAIEKSDFLIFIPISHIYRFLRTSNEPDNPNYRPITKFLEDMGIQSTDALNASSPEKFADIIKEAFQEKAKADYVFHQLLDSNENNNKYGIFFICRHILGAEKFLEVKDKLKSPQFTLDFVNISIESFLDPKRKYSNIDLYEIGIKNGILPKAVTATLKRMEKEKKIEVSTFPEQKRNQKGFYINHKNFKENKQIITIRLNK